MRVARNRESGLQLKQIAADFGISECLANWIKTADVEDGVKPVTAFAEHGELREAKKRIRLLEQEKEVLRRAAAYLCQANLPGTMMYPARARVRRERCPGPGAGRGVVPGFEALPPALLPLAHHAVTSAELTEACRSNALFDAHRDDPEFGCRFLLDQAHQSGEPMAARTVWRLCSDQGWWSRFGKRRGTKLGWPELTPVRRSTTTSCNATSPRPGPTSCG